jgi:oxalyl-CoA decarboxylase
MILMSGSSDRAIIDLQQGDYEELDQLAVAKPFAKAAFRINRPEDIGVGLARAIRAAISGRPGGVYLDITAETLGAVLDAATAKKSLIKPVDPAPRQIPDAQAVDRAVNLLTHAERPLILLGKGAAYAQADQEIRTLVESTGIPFLPMSMAKGLLPDDHELSCAAARSYVLGNADVVMLVGARLNWLLSHGKGPLWSDTTQYIQLDIDATEIDSNRPIAAPVIGDIKSSVSALLQALKPGSVHASASWREEISARKAKNVAKMAERLAANPSPMNFSSALGAVKKVLADRPEVYLVNEGANALDFTRNIIDMSLPRHRLDSGTWGIMGIGMGYAIAAAVETGQPVLAIEGDSAFGFSGMEVETICRYRLPVTIVILNNSGIYRGDTGDGAPSPTGFVRDARYDKLMDAFGGIGYHATTPQELERAVRDGLESGRPTLINAVIDPTAGTESGHIQSLNPKSALQK